MKKFFFPKSVHFPLFTKIAIVALFLSQFSSRKKFLREDKTDCGMKWLDLAKLLLLQCYISIKNGIFSSANA